MLSLVESKARKAESLTTDGVIVDSKGFRLDRAQRYVRTKRLCISSIYQRLQALLGSFYERIYPLILLSLGLVITP